MQIFRCDFSIDVVVVGGDAVLIVTANGARRKRRRPGIGSLVREGGGRSRGGERVAAQLY